MIKERTVTTAIQVSNTVSMLEAYRKYALNLTLVSDDLFVFLTNPTPERDEFLNEYCTIAYTTIDNVITQTYTAI